MTLHCSAAGPDLTGSTLDTTRSGCPQLPDPPDRSFSIPSPTAVASIPSQDTTLPAPTLLSNTSAFLGWHRKSRPTISDPTPAIHRGQSDPGQIAALPGLDTAFHRGHSTDHQSSTRLCFAIHPQHHGRISPSRCHSILGCQIATLRTLSLLSFPSSAARSRRSASCPCYAFLSNRDLPIQSTTRQS